MALVRWQPAGLTHPHHDFDRVFDSFFNHETSRDVPRSWQPAVDVNESPDAYLVTAELPGVEKENVQVSVIENRLTIKGEKTQQTREEKESVRRVERSYGGFSRSFDLPKSVNAEKISATYKDGVLRVAVPKAEEAKPKQIEININ